MSMRSFIQAGNAGTSTIAISLSRYLPVSQNNFTTSIDTESKAACFFRVAGRFYQLYLSVTANTITATSTVNLRKATASVNLTLSIGASSTGEFRDTTNIDEVVAADDFHYLFTTGGTGTAITVCQIKMNFDCTDNVTLTKWGKASNGTALIAVSTVYYWVAGATTSTATEAHRQVDMNTAGTHKNMFLAVSANTRDNSTTFGSRLNAGAGALSISVAATTTGTFEDTTNADTIALNDDVNMYTTIAAGTGTITWTSWASEFHSTKREFSLVNALEQSQSAASTRLQDISGGGTQTTESSQRSEVRMLLKVTNLVMNVATNTLDAGNTAVTVRRNLAAGIGALSIAFGTTGQFEDTSGVDRYRYINDEINTRFVTSGTTGSFQPRNTSVRAIALAPVDLIGGGPTAIPFHR